MACYEINESTNTPVNFVRRYVSGKLTDITPDSQVT
jgi:hypothetical protein